MMKKRRLDVALDADSATLASLERDAKKHHMSDQLAKMAAIRLADYYELSEKLGTYSVEGIQAALALVSTVRPAGKEEPPDTVIALKKEEPGIAPSQDLEDNVEDAASVWGTL